MSSLRIRKCEFVPSGRIGYRLALLKCHGTGALTGPNKLGTLEPWNLAKYIPSQVLISGRSTRDVASWAGRMGLR